MVKVVCINNKNEKFVKMFNNEYLANKFIIKCKYGKSLTIAAVIKEN